MTPWSGGQGAVGRRWRRELFAGSTLAEVFRQPAPRPRRPDLHNRTPANTISFFPAHESRAGFLAETPGAWLPNAGSCSCRRETPHAGGAESPFGGALSLVPTTVAGRSGSSSGRSLRGDRGGSQPPREMRAGVPDGAQRPQRGGHAAAVTRGDDCSGSVRPDAEPEEETGQFNSPSAAVRGERKAGAPLTPQGCCLRCQSVLSLTGLRSGLFAEASPPLPVTFHRPVPSSLPASRLQVLVFPLVSELRSPPPPPPHCQAPPAPLRLRAPSPGFLRAPWAPPGPCRSVGRWENPRPRHSPPSAPWTGQFGRSTGGAGQGPGQPSTQCHCVQGGSE